MVYWCIALAEPLRERASTVPSHYQPIIAKRRVNIGSLDTSHESLIPKSSRLPFQHRWRHAGQVIVFYAPYSDQRPSCEASWLMRTLLNTQLILEPKPINWVILPPREELTIAVKPGQTWYDSFLSIKGLTTSMTNSCTLTLTTKLLDWEY